MTKIRYRIVTRKSRIDKNGHSLVTVEEVDGKKITSHRLFPKPTYFMCEFLKEIMCNFTHKNNSHLDDKFVQELLCELQQHLNYERNKNS